MEPRKGQAVSADRELGTASEDSGPLQVCCASCTALFYRSQLVSPAKSPTLSPTNGMSSREGSIASPQARAMSNASRLPIIAEDENILPLAQRREGAPQSISLGARSAVLGPTLERSSRSQRESSVSFDGQIMVEEIPISPPTTVKPLSPLPPANRADAGHTPLKRPPTPPPQKMTMDGIEDTPTRNNTHINLMLTRSDDEEGDVPLKGPLSMPELPNRPDETNFTLEALSKRLEQVARSPDESMPTIFAQPSPGMLSPQEPASLDHGSQSEVQDVEHLASAAVSPSAVPLPPDQEVNGIKLKKKASTNFGAPFGQLGGFGGRKMS
jgi:hypothetical protein